MNAALFKRTSIRRRTSLSPMASIACVMFQSQLSTPSADAFGGEDSAAKSKVHQLRSSRPRFGRKKDPHFFPPQPVPQTQAP
jgi:hypothetical protein